MTLAILGLLATIIPFVIWLWQKGIVAADDPLVQHKNRYDQIEKDIAAGRSNPAASSDDLDTLDRLRIAAGDTSGPSRDPLVKGPGI